MYMKFKGGRDRALTLSYDDGVVQDIRLMKILDQYGLKCTFNLNSGCFIPEDTVRERFYGKLKASEAKELYTDSGHEVAVHTVSHYRLEKLKTPEIITEVMEDRAYLEKTFGTIVRGMAYPFGTYSDEVIEVLSKCGIAYSRIVKATHSFKLPTNWLALGPTCHHRDEKLWELCDKFMEPCKIGNIKLFYLWGHSYEFDDKDNWDVIERFAERMGGHEEIWYATNIEIYDYVKAYEQLEVSTDKKIIHNPTAIDLWAYEKGETFCIKAGETLYR
ncbi:MAG: polysaccharide deacetylase family protein [Clostridia bacterium]|nr:polysaccharide deacetylase family protein [Clostridia bacterium]